MNLSERLQKLSPEQLALFEDVLRTTDSDAVITAPSVQLSDEKGRLMLAEAAGRSGAYRAVKREIERRSKLKETKNVL